MGNFVFRGVLPTMLAVILFVTAIFFVFLPTFEQTILQRKREMIRELTTAAWNIFAKFENDEQAGLLTREEAQAQAIAQIRNLHYGSQLKDYFWINDMHPRMISHPWRPDLNGQDLTDFKDPEGNQVFLKFVQTVKTQGEGFVSYRWQWKDDASRIVPKLSYVKGFSPWNWIIGTGIYLDDVKQEIEHVTQRLMIISLTILLLVSALLGFILYGSWQSNHQQQRSEQALQKSEERYRLLVESAGDCIIMSLAGERLYANQAMLRLLGYTPDQFAGKRLEEIILPTPDEETQGYANYQGLLEEKDVPHNYESSLRDHQGTLHRVMLSLSRIPLPGQAGFSIIATLLTARHEREQNRSRLIDEMQQSLLFFHTSLGEMNLEPAEITPPDRPVTEIMENLITGHTAAMIVMDGYQHPGIITLPDLWPVCAAVSPDTTSVAGDICRPVNPLPPETLLFDAFLIMQRQNFQPLPVLTSDGKNLKLLTFHHLLQLQSCSPTLLFREVQEAIDCNSLAAATRRGPELVSVMVQNGIRMTHVNHFISTLADMVLQRGLHLVLEKLPPPPVPFTFLVTGSEGRQEQTLCTDQDNGIVFADVPPEKLAETQEYFLDLGRQTCELLNQAGYTFCKGGVMAREKRWCQPLSIWKGYFSRWVKETEPQDLLETKIFFDFRAAFGDVSLAQELNQYLSRLLPDNPRFFLMLAHDVLRFEPPIGLFGNFILESTPDQKNTLNIKSVMVRIVDFTRIYALKNKINVRESSARLSALLKAGIITPQGYQELTQAYSFLMHLRIEHQVQQLRQGEQPDNHIRPDKLTYIEQKMLKEIFSQIKHFQRRLSGDFTGSTGGI